MNKQQLIDEIAANGSIPKAQAAEALDLVLDTMVRRVLNGDDISVTGFGRLHSVHTPARRARNPQTGASVLIPRRKHIKFSPGAAFTAMVRGERPVPPTGRSAASKRPKGSGLRVKTGSPR
ncbi:HU family DNA-binding protein [Streptomyces sp. NBC_01433]|uniref:HU family DNA-binding protein n=1 Tax=Streptomyces sp. NBC_01433 TaxID=2903864 RepID=UPI00225B1653|nr:HU family DNA-binding protein [Streptomyces sp. NBC_01433]MCX4682073.1 HU family DNA-binding protein [Streptomyces sp. NBC_01433]